MVGPSDAHCFIATSAEGGATFQAQPVRVGSCAVTDGGAAFNEDAGPPGPPYGSTEYNTAGNDDDCKYFVSWTSTPIAKDVPVTFWVTAQYATSGAPVTGMGLGDGGGPAVASCPPNGTALPELYLEVAGDPDGGLANHINTQTASEAFPSRRARRARGCTASGQRLSSTNPGCGTCAFTSMRTAATRCPIRRTGTPRST